MDKRQNMLVNVIVAINGNIQNINKNMGSSSEEFKDIKKLIRNARTSVEYINEFINNNGAYITLAGNHLCGTCSNMLKCPKVMDTNKLRLNKYPFITTGVQIITYDMKKINSYNNVIKKYAGKDIILDELDEKTKEVLKNSGRKVELLSVYECDMYCDDRKVEDNKENKKKILI